jgi:predicted NUDIX family NTP pyrophosphohydrolase
MQKLSAGLLMFRRVNTGIEVLLVHPGGPFWQRKDLGSWSIPKGEYEKGQDPLEAAKREFEEETGVSPEGEFISLEEVKQPSGKVIAVWALEGNCSADQVRSNTFQMEWPPKSGKLQEFPEVDRASWFSLEEARDRISKGQVEFIEKFIHRLDYIPKPNHSGKGASRISTQGSLF